MKTLSLLLTFFVIAFGNFSEAAKGKTQKPPTPVYQPEPIFPKSLLAKGKTGIVLVEFVITKEGTTADIKVLESPHKEFSKASVEAVKKWKFTPGELDGKPVGVRVKMPLPFKIRNKKKE